MSKKKIILMSTGGTTIDKSFIFIHNFCGICFYLYACIGICIFYEHEFA